MPTTRSWLSGAFAVAVAVAALLAAGAARAEERLDIQVVPRLGAFNHLAFKPNITPAPGRRTALERADEDLIVPSEWHPRTWHDYLSRIEEKLKAKLVPTDMPRSSVPGLAEEWDVITTSRTNTGYAHRRVLLRVLDAPKGALCTFRVGTDAGQPRTDCAGGSWVYVASNLEVSASARVDVDPTGGRPREWTGTIPEDFLIVAMGDSFLSGQGNPDRRKIRSGAWDECLALGGNEQVVCLKGIRHKGGGSLWMDERCQRSAWSIPIQTGVRLLKAMPQQRGAVTIVSFACSGAKVGDGLNVEYEGQLDFADFIARTDAGQWSAEARTGYAKNGKLRPQKEAVRQLLDDQEGDASARKKTINLLLLDGGGNDVGFSNLVTDLVISKSSADGLVAYERLLTPSFGTLKTHSYVDLEQSLRGFTVRHSILIPYPDPTRNEDDTGCGGTPVDSKVLKSLSRVVKSVYNIFAPTDAQIDAEIRPEEAAFAGKKVLDPLNDAIAALAKRTQSKYFGDPEAARILKGKGWCADGTGKDHFDSSQRWIRKVDESFHLQGDVYGSMHPTWEYHDKVAALIAPFALAAATRNPKPEFTAAHASQPGGAGWVGGTLSVRVDGGGSFNICDVERSSCSQSPATFSYANLHQQRAPELFEVIDTDSLHKTWVKSPYAHDSVDAKAPRRKCWVNGPRLHEHCEDVQYLSGMSEIAIDANDQDSGVARVGLKAGDSTVIETASAARTASASISTVNHRTLPNGPLQLAAYAVDSVGNAGSKTYSFVLDTVPPELISIDGRPYRAGQETLIMSRTSGMTATFIVRDDGTGVCELQFPSQSGALNVTAPPAQPGWSCGMATAPPVLPSNPASFQVAFRPYASDMKDVEFVEVPVVLRDFSGNAAHPETNLLRVAILPSPGCHAPCVLSATRWVEHARLNETNSLRLAAEALGAEVPQMTRSGTSEADVVAASWFNFVSGRYGGTRIVGRKLLNAGCKMEEGDSDVFSSLLNLQACMGRHIDLKAAAVAMQFVARQ